MLVRMLVLLYIYTPVCLYERVCVFACALKCVRACKCLSGCLYIILVRGRVYIPARVS